MTAAATSASRRPRTALVTGAAGGIGSAIVDDLKARGDVVVGVDRHSAPRTRADHFEIADLAADAEGLAARLLDAHERFDILVNCAGIGYDRPAVELTGADLRAVLDINTVAPAVLAARLAPAMLAAGYGRIVNISSIHGRAGHPGQSAYDASKAALDNITRSQASEWTEHGVLVNAVAPGFVRTALCTDEHLSQDWFQEGFLKFGRLPAKRAAEPAEIATIVEYLTSERNTYISGQVIYADGGLYARF
ncbi:3-oxoacyl-[acyl-carrier-protein] reductase [Nocardioides ginsengisoli]|uniref:SDR family NAD(P)-dependent oxidoreductase n=1 Tax=Nocardioides ginsengisoli TaxID=363868 RepID=A0ABW3W4T5_9ACTN